MWVCDIFLYITYGLGYIRSASACDRHSCINRFHINFNSIFWEEPQTSIWFCFKEFELFLFFAKEFMQCGVFSSTWTPCTVDHLNRECRGRPTLAFSGRLNLNLLYCMDVLSHCIVPKRSLSLSVQISSAEKCWFKITV